MRLVLASVLGGLATASLAAQVALPFADLPAAIPYEVASVRPVASAEAVSRTRNAPGRYSVSNFSVVALLATSLGVPADQIVGGPDWVRTDRFDVTAVAPGVALTDISRVGLAVLERRFALQLRIETTERPIYELVRSRAGGTLGPNLTPRQNCSPAPQQDGLVTGSVRLTCRSWNPRYVTLGADRPVVDRTGLAGLFDIRLEWSPGLAAEPADRPQDGSVSLFTALQEQLGLRLNPTRGTVAVVAIASIEKPTPD